MTKLSDLIEEGYATHGVSATGATTETHWLVGGSGAAPKWHYKVCPLASAYLADPDVSEESKDRFLHLDNMQQYFTAKDRAVDHAPEYIVSTVANMHDGAGKGYDIDIRYTPRQIVEWLRDRGY